MNAQPLPLFDIPPTGAIRHGDYGTSIAAAQRVGQSRVGLQARIMEQLRKEPGGLTDRELCRRIVPEEPLRWQSVISARNGLQKKHLVEATGREREGRQVWRAFGAIQEIEVVGDVL